LCRQPPVAGHQRELLDIKIKNCRAIVDVQCVRTPGIIEGKVANLRLCVASGRELKYFRHRYPVTITKAVVLAETIHSAAHRAKSPAHPGALRIDDYGAARM